MTLVTGTPTTPVKEKIIKILVVGGYSTGKTALIRRFTNNTFTEAKYQMTIGTDLASKSFVLRDGRPVRLQLWDIAGMFIYYLTSTVAS
eukprot:ANDGO_07840.mRNA.1 Ras-related protein Rab-1C